VGCRAKALTSLCFRFQGTLVALAAFSEGRMVDKMKSAALLTPVAYLSHITTPIGMLLSKAFVGEVTSFSPCQRCSFRVLLVLELAYFLSDKHSVLTKVFRNRPSPTCLAWPSSTRQRTAFSRIQIQRFSSTSG
jgi:hypothetical protein